MFNFMNISFIYLLLLAFIYILFDFTSVLYLFLITFTLVFIRVVSPNSFSSRPATAWGQSDVSKSLQDRFNEVLTNNIVLTTLKDTFHSLLNTSTSGKTKSSMNNSFSEFGRLSLSSTRSPQQPNRTRIAPSRRPSFSGRLLSPSPTVYRASPGSVTNAAGPLLSARFLPTVKRALGLDTVSNSPFAQQEERRPLYPQHSHAGFMLAVKLGRREKTRLDNSFSSVRSPNAVRIAPPDPHRLSSPRLFKVKPTNSNESRRAPDTQAVVTALKEKSRKRALDGTELTFQEIPNQLAKRRRQESQQSNASTSSLPPLPDSLPDLSTSGYSVPRVKTPVMKQHKDTPPLKHPANNGENTPSLKRTANMTDLTEADQEEHVNKRAKTDPSVHNSLVSSLSSSRKIRQAPQSHSVGSTEDYESDRLAEQKRGEELLDSLVDDSDKAANKENKRLSDAKATLSALVNSSSTAPASSSLSNTISTATASSTSSVPSSLIGQSVTTPTIGQTAPASADNKKSPVSEGAKVSAPSGIGFNFAKPATSPVSSPTASVTQTTSASAPTGVLAALAGMTSSASSSVAGSAPSTTSSSGISSVGGFTFGAKNLASSPPTAPSNPGPNSTGTGTSTSATFTFSAASPPKSTVTSGFSLGSSALASTAASNLSVVSGFATTQPQLSLATSTSSSTSAPTGFTLPSAFAAPSAGGFTFGQALSAASETEPPKTTSASTVSPAASTFNFGAAASSTSGSSNPASTSSNFAFGQVSKPVTAPASAGFNFGGSSNTPTTSAAFTSTSSAVFGFGASTPPPTNTTATGNTSSAFTFSGTTTSTASGSTLSSNNFNFGGTSAPSFGAPTTTKIGGFSFNPGATTTTSSSMAPAASFGQVAPGILRYPGSKWICSRSFYDEPMSPHTRNIERKKLEHYQEETEEDVNEIQIEEATSEHHVDQKSSFIQDEKDNLPTIIKTLKSRYKKTHFCACKTTETPITHVVIGYDVSLRQNITVHEEEFGMKVILKNPYQINNEAVYVNNLRFKEERRCCSSTDLTIFQKCIAEYASHLWEKHSNLTIITGDNFRSVNGEPLPETCIVFYCLSKGFIPVNEEPFPKKLSCDLGILKTDVREGYFVLGTTHMRGYPDAYNDPICMGSNIGTQLRDASGSLGLFINLPCGENGFITCCHVLFDCIRPQPFYFNKTTHSNAHQVLQPGNAAICGRDLQEKFCGEIQMAKFNPKSSPVSVDVALVKICNRIPSTGHFVVKNNAQVTEIGYEPNKFPVYDTGKVRRKIDISDLEKPLLKSGTSSGLTRSWFKLNGCQVRIFPEGVWLGTQAQETIVMKGQYEVESGSIHNPFFITGDSGSAVFQKEIDGKLVCIGIAIGKTSYDTTVVTPIGAVLDALGLTDSDVTKLHS